MHIPDLSLDDCRDGAKLREALLDCGLVVVSSVFGPTERDALNVAIAASQSFFSLPTEDKLRHVSKDRARRGYCATSTENFASLIGQKNVNDAVEKFRVGPHLQLTESDVEYFYTKASRVHFYPNVTEAPLYPALSKYYDAFMRGALTVLVQAVDEAFGMGGKVQDSVDARHTSILAANYYPAAPAEAAGGAEGAVAIAPHTDVSLFTLIAATGPGLQVQSASTGSWLDVPHVEGSLILNLGDCLSEIPRAHLNGARSALHRALASVGQGEGEGTPRLSLALFVAPRHDAALGWPGLSPDACSYDDWRRHKVKRCMQIAKGGTPT
jgi:isopenicillin N synthase-like dioxygenase